MPITKKQLPRLIKIVARLKENRPFTSKTFAEELRKLDIDDNLNISCSPKTIKRDIELLRDEYDAPIEFDYTENTYRLKHKGWNLSMPGIMDENEMLASVLGARLAEDIFPEPLRSAIREAVDYQLTNNNPDFLDTASLKSLIVATKLNIQINPDIFLAVFDAWKAHEAIEIQYEAQDGRISNRRIEPRILAFYDQAWYIKGICLLRNAVRTFAVHRIQKVLSLNKYFDLDQELVDRVFHGNFLEYEMINDIEIECERELKSHLLAKPFHPEQSIIELDSKHFQLKIPAAPEHEILKWVMYQSGKAKLIKPDWLISKIKETSDFLSKIHSS